MMTRIHHHQPWRLDICISHSLTHAQAVFQSNFFYSAQRVGKLPADNSVPWRGESLTYETGV
jgi:hypothetical protein